MGRCLRDSGKVGSLCQVHIFCINAEIILARFFHAVDGAAVSGFVQVRVEYLVFGVDACKAQRENYLFYFAQDCFVLREERIFYDLLRDGRAALSVGTGCEVGKQRAQERERAEAGIAVKGVVFDRDRTFLDVRTDLVERHGRAANRPVHVVEDDVAGAVVDLGRLRDLTVLKIIDSRYRGERRPQYRRTKSDKDYRDERDYRQFHPRREASPQFPELSKHSAYSNAFSALVRGELLRLRWRRTRRRALFSYRS